ncbi:MAG: FtsX-like permease family protein [Planctomycetes bacterium]|nr:FtsX-like permease family protein [Planctomycetota bacterium]
MSTWLLVLRGLRHHARTHAGVAAGVMCAAAVLIGALSVGDSVRWTLREQALQRIGRVEAALVAGDRFVRAELAATLSAELGGATCAAAITLPGVAARGGGAVRTGIVDVFGVDSRFFALSTRGVARAPIAPGHALVNDRLAAQLHVGVGDEVLVRVERPSAMPREATLAQVDDVSFALRVIVDGIVGDQEFGRFGLRASQVPPFDLFLPLGWLQEQLELPGRANLLVVDAPAERANAALRRSWRLDDAELTLRTLDGGAVAELTSRRVFIDAHVVDALAQLDGRMLGVFTYFVNAMRVGAAETPYSLVSGIGPLVAGASVPAILAATLRLVPDSLGDDQIVLNDWAAADLGAKPGDAVELDYFVMGSGLRLEQRSSTLTVRSMVPLTGAAADPGLMPELPGLADARSCRDWDPGVPIELERLDDADQAYWDAHRGTPKAFTTLRAARALWGNRFGSLTAVRAPVALAERIADELPRRVEPAALGLRFADLRGPALAAGASATDFGGLFLGLSLFLIVAALLLTALLFAFGVEQRASEIGTLLALGFSPSAVRRLLLLEASALAVAGAVLGAVAGVAYTHAVLGGLGTLWRDAVGQTSLTVHIVPASVAGGASAAIAAALLALALTLRRVARRPAVELLRGMVDGVGAAQRGHGRASVVLSGLTFVLAVSLVTMAGTSSDEAAGAFFGAGALVLASALFACRRLLMSLAAGAGVAVRSVAALGLRNAGRRPGRSLATIGLLASGTFLVVSVQAHRLEPPLDPSVRESGTGGFALFGRSTLPVLRGLDTASARAAYGLDGAAWRDVRIVPLRVRDGDDASCLNLSLPQNPQLVGVDAAELADRGAFRFVATATPAGESPWRGLDLDLGDGVVPAIGDAASVTWSLHKEVGDSLSYEDEVGRRFEVRIVGTVADSILQGNLVVAERHLEERFPSATGYRMFLIDAPKAQVDAVTAGLTRAFLDIGLEVTPTAQRLAAFQAVQNTYLSIFGVLGGLGLLLGTVGLGAVVLRSALERRAELAVARAVGFRTGALRQLVWSEHAALLALGLGSGVVAALMAIGPSLGASHPPPLGSMIGLVAVVAASGALWTWLATVFVTRGPLLEALRGD